MTRMVVVAGTDTAVGKTVVTAGLARALVAAGRRTIAVKPIESGCASEEPSPDEDGVRLALATGQGEPTEALVRLREPLAPALAADRENVEIDVSALARRIAQVATGAEVVLIEGAGGVLSPLSWTQDLTDLARSLDAAMLIVGADRLGTLSQVRLGVRAVLEARLTLLGVVLSAPAMADASTGTNQAALERCLAPVGPVAQRIVAVPRVSAPDAVWTTSPADRTARERLGAVIQWIDATVGRRSVNVGSM